ncbi:protein kinase, partial [bacterium]|nr:protein kinase [bacterium]
MALSVGTRLGPYEILAPLGAGGMGEVYKATDTRLGRTVAIKVLSSNLSKDPDQQQRFEREARTISNLSNPHICTLYDIGHQGGVEFLVMEYLEGETLADQLQKGPLSIDQVLRYGIQIADGLAEAHRNRIVHRDLKPRNIMITKSGVKLLDFGLAKWRELDSHRAGNDSELTTMERSLTKEGSLVGTLQYMAPEQLQGKNLDDRADIFALGAILYEMVTGQKAFQGDNQASLIASILSSEPQRLSAIQRYAPPLLEHAINKCLVKDPDLRWRCAHDLSIELSWIADSGFQQAIEVQKPARGRIAERIAWAVAVALLSTLLIFFSLNRAPTLHPVSFSIPPPENSIFDGSIALSPDGRHLAFVATDAAGQSLIWVRRLDSLTAQPLPGTQNAAFPFWSPDNGSLAFFVEGKLKKIPLSGGSPQTICEVLDPRGGAWSHDGVI